MTSNWRLKAYLTLFLILLSAYLLVPSFYNFRELREVAEAKQQKLPWYVQVFPDDQINLGLDLRGGIYLELEVELDRALVQNASLTAQAIQRFLKEKNIPYTRVNALPKSTTIEAVLPNPDDVAQIQNFLREFYGNDWKKASNQADTAPGTFYFKPTENYLERLKNETVEQAVVTVRNRIDRYGVAEPDIRRLERRNRIVVEMPGEKDPDRAISLIKRAGNLEFKLVDSSVEESQVQVLVDQARKDANIPAGDYSIEVVDKINEALKGKIPEDSEIAYELQYDAKNKIIGGKPYLLKRQVQLSGKMLQKAQVSVQNNEPYVNLSFNPEGARIFAEVTAANVGKNLAILLDGAVNKAPVIEGPIPGGEARITLGYGNYEATLREAEDLVVVLREGALPATLKEVTKTVIGASLGASSIKRGFQATLIAGLAVILFMALWYKGGGLLADFALVLNVLFIFACLSLFGATLTLPGVAGIVLTIGMAVDANVIILERIKEELAGGKTAKAAVDAGYANAMSAIVDANITTFLAGIILYQFGTGPVRGFAVTLMIGIVTTLFTAMVVTRLFYDFRLSRSKTVRLSL